ncbi:hypothetical protein KDA_10370 [Dictyobacter alpinus]|uniref:CHAD domain-containing protein n=1 Tax=Dictyobacter alpinus TaxID=2014873 RepID=A0A402B2J7_9CHLR|nr:CHAD domain-containing protein [Dictyobacter alpinus]GCE25553.1 hypothetical protein KDA_10370 [Dictyobacter alpinus]
MAKAKTVTGLDMQSPVGVSARKIARIRLEEMYSWDSYVDNPYEVLNLHNLRIASKRLRYTLEIFSEAFPADSGKILKEVEQIQEELGSLHDDDVMIALLRLCLGGQDSGSGYEHALTTVAQHADKGHLMVNPALVEHLLQPSSTLNAEQREGLELLLSQLQQQRESQYETFRDHWYRLKTQNFKRQVLDMLKDA